MGISQKVTVRNLYFFSVQKGLGHVFLMLHLTCCVLFHLLTSIPTLGLCLRISQSKISSNSYAGSKGLEEVDPL